MDWHDLIVVAEVLAQGAVQPQTGRSRQAELRRSVSTIYYAAFHAFAENNANTLIGSGPQAHSDPAWELTYRAIDHGRTRARCDDRAAISRFPPEIREMAALFVRLQAMRHRADYASHETYSRSQVLQLAIETRQSIDAFESVDLNQRRSFAAYLLFQERIR